MADYIGFDADDRYVFAEVLPVGTPIAIDDFEQDVLFDHALHISNSDFGVIVEGSKAKLVDLLERALHQAWSLPDDPPTGEA